MTGSKQWLMVVLILAALAGCREKDPPTGGGGGGGGTGDSLRGALSGVLARGEYRVLDSIWVAEDSALTIQPGVTLRFAGAFGFGVKGVLTAEGALADSIRFVPAAGNTQGWTGIAAVRGNAERTRLAYCVIEGVVPRAGGQSSALYSDRPLLLADCRISGNRAHAVAVFGAGLTADRCVITGNAGAADTAGAPAVGGGGIAVTDGSMRLDLCRITDNSTRGWGGGVLASGSAILAEDCLISGNEARQGGGGLWLSGPRAQLLDCTVDSNTCGSQPGHAGGIMAGSDSTRLIECRIRANRSEFGGGGLSAGGAVLSAESCEISLNTARVRGGGVDCPVAAQVRLEYCLLRGNSAPHGGGAYLSNAAASVINCTLVGNHAELGGGLYCAISSATLTTSIVASSEPDAMYFVDSPEMAVRYNDFWGSTVRHFSVPDGGGAHSPDIGRLELVNVLGDSCDAAMNIYLDPLFINAAEHDYQIQNSSPCVDSGDPDLPRDPDGSLRDMGAFRHSSGN